MLIAGAVGCAALVWPYLWSISGGNYLPELTAGRDRLEEAALR